MDSQTSATIQLLTRANGAGLSRDLELLQGMLEDSGFDVHRKALPHQSRFGFQLARWQRSMKPRRAANPAYDINVMLERVYPEYFDQARYNVLVPNPEWLKARWLPCLSQFDLVLAKTHYAAKIFQQLDCKTAWTGFTSPDRLDDTIPKTALFLHVPGRSNTKGTAHLLALWARHPEWPTLTVVWRSKRVRKLVLPANVVLLANYVEDGTLRKLQNQHRFHLCPSQTEGYGHSLVEAMSTGAVVITNDAPPMNELVSAERGLLVDAVDCGTQELATLYDFVDSAMESVIQTCIHMTPETSQALGTRARHWYETNRVSTAQRISTALRDLVLDKPVSDPLIPTPRGEPH